MDHAADAHQTDLMTITRFVLNEHTKHQESRGDFTILLNHIVFGCKFVYTVVNKRPATFDQRETMAIIVASVFRTTTASTAATILATGAKPKTSASPFRIPTQKPLI
nr:fructose-1,6-bisphosphatase, cytosolic [Ipomoea batatas]